MEWMGSSSVIQGSSVLRTSREQATRNWNMKIAVVGGGIAGLGAAWALSAMHDVTLIEAEPQPGGHSRTLDIGIDGRSVSVDTGFIVYNERNYPNLTQLLSTLGAPTVESDMSFAVSLEEGSFEYAGRASGLFSSPRAVWDRQVWGVLSGIVRFRSESRQLRESRISDDVDIHTYLVARGYSAAFIDRYLMPLASAVWSGTRNDARAMPAKSFLQFLDNHGLIAVTDRPQWRTVDGGSRTYVDRIVKEITRVHTSRPVRAVRRSVEGVTVVDVSGEAEEYDQVVLATHADLSLRLLGNGASDAERRILSPFRYESNEVVLHTDTAAMPRLRRIWSSWNAIERMDDDGAFPVSVSYWMNRLQPIQESNDLFVTLNPGGMVRDGKVLDRWTTTHPQFDLETLVAQQAFPSIQGSDRVWFAGAYLGHGFHEDGLQSGLTVAAALGAPAPWHNDVVPRSPAAFHAARNLESSAT